MIDEANTGKNGTKHKSKGKSSTLGDEETREISRKEVPLRD